MVLIKNLDATLPTAYGDCNKEPFHNPFRSLLPLTQYPKATSKLRGFKTHQFETAPLPVVNYMCIYTYIHIYIQFISSYVHVSLSKETTVCRQEQSLLSIGRLQDLIVGALKRVDDVTGRWAARLLL